MPKRIDDAKVYRTVCRLMVDAGYDGMTTKDLADSAGINEVSLFRRYRTKAELVCTAVNETLSKVELSEQEYTGDLERDLTAIVEAYINTVREYGPLIPVLMIELRRHPELAEAFASVRKNLETLAAILDCYIGDGRLQGVDGFQLLGVLFGPLLLKATNPLSPDPTDSLHPDAGDHVRRFLGGYAR